MINPLHMTDTRFLTLILLLAFHLVNQETFIEFLFCAQQYRTWKNNFEEDKTLSLTIKRRDI